MLTYVTLEVSRVCKTKSERTGRKHCPLVDKAISCRIWVNKVDVAIQAYWIHIGIAQISK